MNTQLHAIANMLVSIQAENSLLYEILTKDLSPDQIKTLEEHRKKYWEASAELYNKLLDNAQKPDGLEQS